MATAHAGVAERLKPCNPSPDYRFRKPQINAHTPLTLMLFQFAAAAGSTPITCEPDDSIGGKNIDLKVHTPLVYRFQMWMSPNENPFTLVVEIGAFVYYLQVLKCVFFRSKNLPTRTAFLQFIRALHLEGVRGGFRSCGNPGTHFAHQFTKALQRAAIIFVVTNEACFEFRVSALLPISAPDDTLKSCNALNGTLAPQESADVFEAIRVCWEVNVRMYHRQDIRCVFQNEIDLRMEMFRHLRFHSF